MISNKTIIELKEINNIMLPNKSITKLVLCILVLIATLIFSIFLFDGLIKTLFIVIISVILLIILFTLLFILKTRSLNNKNNKILEYNYEFYEDYFNVFVNVDGESHHSQIPYANIKKIVMSGKYAFFYVFNNTFYSLDITSINSDDMSVLNDVLLNSEKIKIEKI